MHSAQLVNLQRALRILHCALCSMHCTLRTLHCANCNVHCTSCTFGAFGRKPINEPFHSFINVATFVTIINVTKTNLILYKNVIIKTPTMLKQPFTPPTKQKTEVATCMAITDLGISSLWLRIAKCQLRMRSRSSKLNSTIRRPSVYTCHIVNK